MQTKSVDYATQSSKIQQNVISTF